MSIQVVPHGYIDSRWAQDLGWTGSRTLADMSLLLFDARLKGEPICIRLPEAIGSLANAPQSFRYVVGQRWRVSRAGQWSYPGTSLQQFNSDKEPVAFSGEVSCTTHMQDNGLTARLTVKNGDYSTWKSVYLWVCVMYNMTPSIDAQTMVSIDGELVPYDRACPAYVGPAGMRLATRRGREEFSRLLEEGSCVEDPFAPHPIADPVRAACAVVGGTEIWIVVESSQAVVLGGYDKNPCSDMALGYGDILPGDSATADLRVHLIEGDRKHVLATI